MSLLATPVMPTICKLCKLCDKLFTVKPGESAFFIEKGLSLPLKCRPCRAAIKGAGGDLEKARTWVNCEVRETCAPRLLKSRDEHGGKQKQKKGKK